MSVFNETPEEFYDLNGLFPVLNSAVGLTYVQFQKLVENTIWLRNREDKIGVVYSYVASGSPSRFGQYWLSETDGGSSLTPRTDYLYVVLSSGNYEKWLFRWNGTNYIPLNKDFESYASATDFPMTGISNIFYLALDTSVIYYWNGTDYVEASGTDLTNYYTKTETNDLLDEKADIDRIQNVVNPTIYGGISYGGGAGESGVSFTDLNSLLYSGFYTCYGTTANVPSSSTSWFIEHINSNVGTATATQFAYAYNDNKVIYKRTKTSGTWGSWEKINLPKVVSDTDVVVAVEDWVADTTYTDYDYKAVLTLTGMLSTYEPSVVFGLVEVETGNYASVCLAGTDSITIYAKEIPSASITIPLIKGEQL